MKLWHDDVRRAPRGWEWVRTNEDAKRLLATGTVEAISLDHDLGLEDLDPDTPGAVMFMGQGEETGLDLVRWMLDNDHVPRILDIHSMNVVCGLRMAQTFADAGFEVTYEPYSAELVRALELL